MQKKPKQTNKTKKINQTKNQHHNQKVLLQVTILNFKQ